MIHKIVLVNYHAIYLILKRTHIHTASHGVESSSKEESQDSINEGPNTTINISNDYTSYPMDETILRHQAKAKEKTVFFSYGEDFSAIKNRNVG